ncbi:MAG TPA: phytanoyl-CoA dioxygenase family protein [Caldilineaceae bacterium]|nr:phytanoyl-CoA dioxygenase family protein [Caldilineaceae bacterium]
MITQEQIQSFQEDGYLRYGRVLTMAEVDELRAALDEVIAIELAGGDESQPEFRFGHRRGQEQATPGQAPRPITQYVNMWKRSPAYERLIHHPVIAGVAAALLETPRVRLWHDQVISKPPGENGHFRFHQDFYLWPLRDPQILSCWLALDDASPENGCMHVVPRSHSDPRFGLDAYAAEQAAKAAAEAAGREPEETDRQKMAHEPAAIGLPIELKAGECMFHHCLNFHATPANITDRQRRAHVMIFMAEGVRVNLAQSPRHPLIPTFEVGDGEELVGAGYPLSRAVRA